LIFKASPDRLFHKSLFYKINNKIILSCLWHKHDIVKIWLMNCHNLAALYSKACH
jgi:hypothetical protein